MVASLKKSFAIGVDIGATSISCHIVDDEGVPVKLSDQIEERMPGESDPREAVGRLKVACDRVLAAANLCWDDIAALGFTFPGYIDKQGVVRFAPNLTNKNWVGCNLLDEVRKTVIPEGEMAPSVWFGNDGDAAAYYEAKLRGEKEELFLFAFGSGIGGGCVNSGWLFKATFPAVEIGHICIPHVPFCNGHDPLCSCGKRGHAEAYASIGGLSQLLKTLDANGLLEGHELQTNSEGLSWWDRALKVRSLADAGDTLARSLFYYQAERIGACCAMVAHIFGTPDISIGGGWGELADQQFKNCLLETIRVSHSQHIMSPVYKDVRIEWALAGDDAGALGAALLAMELGAIGYS